MGKEQVGVGGKVGKGEEVGVGRKNWVDVG